MSFEYKTVGAPEKGKRRKGAHSQSDRAAAAFEEILRTEAVDGWEYLRTDILPVTERRSWLGGQREAHRAVMVFRRALAPARDVEAPAQVVRDASEPKLRADPKPTSEPLRSERREPGVSADPDRRLAEIVRGPGNLPNDKE